MSLTEIGLAFARRPDRGYENIKVAKSFYTKCREAFGAPAVEINEVWLNSGGDPEAAFEEMKWRYGKVS
jgi:hypothetical protein